MAEHNLCLEIKDLQIQFNTDEGLLKAVDRVSFNLEKGRTLGIVGESGCGKSLTSKTIIGINPKTSKAYGEINYFDEGKKKNLLEMKRNGEEIRGLRGSKLSMIFQEPMTAFSPLYTIGNQIVENILLHRTTDKKEAKQIAIDMMKKVGIANPEKRYNQYPMEFSGGMRQRAMIAMALACKPDVLIADEPTTALDVTIQAQVLQMMKELQQEMNMSILFITHDLGVIAEMCEDVVVMYLGKIVEMGYVEEIFESPKHPYTKGLLKSLPKLGSQGQERLESIEGTVPVPIDLPNRCGFYDRCEYRMDGVCENPVEMISLGDNREVRCHLYKDKALK